MNKIPATQLEPTQLKRLAAQRQLYSDAKVIQAVQIVLNVLGPPILAVLVAFFSLRPVYAACCGIIVVLLNIFYFTLRQQSLKKKAANIQELFDCDVLGLPWRELTAGSPLEIETVEKYFSKYKRKYKRKADDDSKQEKWYSKLENWYPKDVGKLPLHLGRVICQRSNCWWDAELRRRYASWVLVVLSVLTVLTLCLGLIGDFTVEKLILALVIPLVPAFVLGIQQYRDHKKAAERLDKLKAHAEDLWKKALIDTKPDAITDASRDLQNEIYNHRRTCPLIFDWLYKYLRKEHEELMNKATDVMVKEALESLQE